MQMKFCSYMVSNGAGSTSDRDTPSCSNNLSTSPKTEPQTQEVLILGIKENKPRRSVHKTASAIFTRTWFPLLKCNYTAISICYILNQRQRVIKISKRLPLRLPEISWTTSGFAYLWWLHSPHHAFGILGWKSLALKPLAFCHNRASLLHGISGQALSAGTNTKPGSWTGQYQNCIEGDVFQVQMRMMKLMPPCLWQYSPLNITEHYIYMFLYMHEIISLIEPNFSSQQVSAVWSFTGFPPPPFASAHNPESVSEVNS